uniref:Uncharacterized protein n=1 Tax=Glossina pallidipes TaxID=7398 RepID=A0A1A9Z650_GLOPL
MGTLVLTEKLAMALERFLDVTIYSSSQHGLKNSKKSFARFRNSLCPPNLQQISRVVCWEVPYRSLFCFHKKVQHRDAVDKQTNRETQMLIKNIYAGSTLRSVLKQNNKNFNA